MKKLSLGTACLLALPFLLSGCGAVGSKSLSLPVIYAASSLFAVGILVGYACFSKKLNPWLLMLLVCVTVVNTGYFMLSVAGTLEMALWSNRISYLGSVFLPFTMLMSIMDVCKLKRPKWMISTLVGVGIIVFLIAASPGILDIYYKEVTLGIVDGVCVLQKVYGPLHSIYLYYLVLYFTGMLAVILYARYKERSVSITYAVLLLVATLVNIAVWLLEQLVQIHFEFLSVSYIISVLFLLGVDALASKIQTQPAVTVITTSPAAPIESQDFTDEQYRYFVAQLPTLTPTERMVFDLYAEGKCSKDILVIMNFKENTLKYHNRNVYSKLGISNRKQLKALAAALNSRTAQ
jgi:DNA-binding CsgD family transcriptional regulator